MSYANSFVQISVFVMEFDFVLLPGIFANEPFNFLIDNALFKDQLNKEIASLNEPVVFLYFIR